ncbi:MAG: precorrin-6A reductase, partial [Anaerovoracaceae bacterium]
MANILLFAGTTEGRLLAEAIAKVDSGEHRYFISVATEYGKDLLDSAGASMKILCGRQGEGEMAAFLQKERIHLVIDATHPYATEVSKNIEGACARIGVKRYRLSRKETPLPKDCICVQDVREAAEYLDSVEGNVLLTTGSKELGGFTGIAGFAERLFPRMLPAPEMILAVLSMGYRQSNLICMQGPFSLETNIGMLRQIKGKFLVTKESGDRGGFLEKCAAAQQVGARVIVIRRPKAEESISMKEAYALCGLQWQEKKRWFPLFVDMEGKKILVVGGGKIAKRRVDSLAKFAGEIQVVTKDCSWTETRREVQVTCKAFAEEDLEGMDLVIAATDDSAVNEEIYRLCKTSSIPVNVASEKEKCDFYFPGIISEEGMTIGVIADGQDHKKAKQ